MSTNALKWIAIITMLIDHVGAVFFSDVIILRLIGRLAFPIFAFLIVQGFLHTKNIKKYIIRLGLFAIISEIPFDLAFNDELFELTSQNVFFTLLIGLIAIVIFDELKEKNKIMAGASILILSVFALYLRTDYDLFGVLMIFVFYLFKDDFSQAIFYIIYINALLVLGSWSADNFRSNPWNFIQGAAPLSLILIKHYNGKKGGERIKNQVIHKYFFYIFYPLHLLILALINYLL